MGVATVDDATDAPPDVATMARSLRLRLIFSCKREEAEPPAPLTEIVLLLANETDDEGVAGVVLVVAVSSV
jgi:hypothetical protein